MNIKTNIWNYKYKEVLFVDVILKNKNKMKRYMESFVGVISSDDFREWIEYLIESVDYIEEDIPEQNDLGIIKKASLTFEGLENDYEVYVDFIKIIGKDTNWIVDLDYTQPIEEI